jgi:glutaredoxin
MNITLYTTPTCPDCQALKAWLGQKGIAYQEKDLTDTTIQAEAKARYGVRIAPITVVDDKFFYGTFAEQRPKLQELLQQS